MSFHDQEKKIIDQFSIRIKTYDNSAKWMMNSELIQAHVKLLDSVSGSRKSLELCCGTGLVGRALVKSGWNMKGLDLTPEMVAVANKYFPTIVGNVENIPFSENTFDAAVLRQSFMLLNGTKTLKEVHRILKKDGLFILSQSVPFNSGDDVHYEKIQWTRHINMKTYYNSEDLQARLRENGFEIIETLFLSIEESVNKWVENAPELSSEIRTKILNLVEQAPESYKKSRQVTIRNQELFENWNWVVIKARALK